MKALMNSLLLILIMVGNNAFAGVKDKDLMAIGNSKVDIIANVGEDEFQNWLAVPYSIKKGDSININQEQNHELFARLSRYQVNPTGSSANVVADIASLGAFTNFTSIIANDDIGNMFNDSLKYSNVRIANYSKVNNKLTSRTYLLRTPDGDITTLFYEGIAADFSERDINYDDIKNYKILYIEGGIIDASGPRYNAIMKAIETAKKTGTEVAFNMQSSLYTSRYKNEYLKIIPEVDIVFGNEAELIELYRATDIDSALNKLKQSTKLAIITMAEKGAMVASNGHLEKIEAILAEKQDLVVDTEGAGDAFAAGFLYGRTSGMNVTESAKLGAKSSAYIIQQPGARPKGELADLL
jgi:sugar/nucleoside kinase (ribokinase family)